MRRLTHGKLFRYSALVIGGLALLAGCYEPKSTSEEPPSSEAIEESMPAQTPEPVPTEASEGPIVFSRDGDIWVTDPSAAPGDEEENLTETDDMDELEPDWSHQTEEIVYAVSLFSDDEEPVDEGDEDEFVDEDDPDAGERFARAQDESNEAAIYLMDSSGDSEELIGPNDDLSQDFTALEQPTWSPSGGLIAFSGVAAGEEDAEVWLYDLGSGSLTRLNTDGADQLDPAWSPRADHLAYVTDAEGDYDIYLDRMGQGTDIGIVTKNACDDMFPAFAPLAVSELMLAWSTDAAVGGGCGDQLDIVKRDVGSTTGQLIRLTTSEADDLEPTWSPDGRQIAFVSERSADADIFRMPADGESSGSAVSAVTTGDEDDESPDWKHPS